MASLLPNGHVLLICVARIGDTLLTTPAMRAVRAAIPNGQLTVLAHPGRREILEGLPFIDILGAIDKHSAAWRGWLPGRSYDWGVVYGYDAALVRYALRTCRRVIALRQTNDALNRRLALVVESATELMDAVDERLGLVTPLGIAPQGRRLAYQVAEAEQAEARALLRRSLPAARRIVGLQLQSFPSKAYRDWPLEHFLQLAEGLLALDDIGVAVLGGTESRRLGETFVARLGEHHPGRVVSLAGSLRLRQAAAVIGELALYVGVDTGPTHLAGALGVPMAALYHCRHRGRWLAPREHPALEVLEHPAADAECDRQSAMADIPVARVVEACERLLARDRP